MSTSPGSKSLALAALGFLAALAAPACVTTTEGQKMQADISVLRARLDEIDKRDKEYKAQVIRLKKVLDEATALLTRNSADVGAKVAKSEQDIAALQGRIEGSATTSINKRARTASPRTGSRRGWRRWSRRRTRSSTGSRPRCRTTRTSCGRRPGSGWRRGSGTTGGAFTGCSFSASRRTRGPAGVRRDRMPFVQEGKYPNAAAEFQKVLNTYPSSPEVPEAMWQLSLSFVQLHFCTDAPAAVGHRQAISQIAARERRPGRAEVDRQAAPLGLHQLAPSSPIVRVRERPSRGTCRGRRRSGGPERGCRW